MYWDLLNFLAAEFLILDLLLRIRILQNIFPQDFLIVEIINLLHCSSEIFPTQGDYHFPIANAHA